jgi:hypothetical protein
MINFMAMLALAIMALTESALGENCSHRVVVDQSGYVYVTGQSYGSVTNYDFATVKYDPVGNQLWAAIYTGHGGSVDETHSLAVDAFGNAYVTGWSDRPFMTMYATVKYDPSGAWQWVALYANLKYAIGLLIQQVQAIDLKNGAGYTAKLDAALASYQEATSHDYINTINQLEAFINMCENDPKLTETDRASLIATANEIIAYIQSKI